jgi:hypothetical protein
MRRSGGRIRIRGLAVGALATVGLALAPAGASGVIDVWHAYADLTTLKPVPLVAMNFPAALGPVGEIEIDNGIEGHGRYSLLFSHVIPAKHPGGRPGLAGNLLLKSFGAVSLAKEARLSKPLYHVSHATVRGHRAVLIKGRHKPTVGLIWSEGGSLYALGTGTPKTVSVAELQQTATALEHLTGQVKGETPPEDGYTGKGLSMFSRAVLGERTALVEASWTAECQEIPGNESGPRGFGQTTLALPLGAGGSVSFGPAPVVPEDLARSETAAWTVGVAGSLTPGGGQLTESATGTSNGRACTVGPSTFALAPFH